jgi:hypothetical protein
MKPWKRTSKRSRSSWLKKAQFLDHHVVVAHVTQHIRQLLDTLVEELVALRETAG